MNKCYLGFCLVSSTVVAPIHISFLLGSENDNVLKIPDRFYKTFIRGFLLNLLLAVEQRQGYRLLLRPPMSQEDWKWISSPNQNYTVIPRNLSMAQ